MNVAVYTDASIYRGVGSWATVILREGHDTGELLALRMNEVDPSTFDYASPVPLFASGAEACAHGMSGVHDPSPAALAAMAKLERRR